MKARTPKPPQTVKRGRRSHEERAGGRLRLTIREVPMREGDYSWTTYMVQGFKNDAGKWARKKFKDRAAAETFVARMTLGHLDHDDPRRPIMTTLTTDQVRVAELAFLKLAPLGEGADMIAAVSQYADHWRKTVAVERVSFRDARNECLRDKEARRVIRDRSAVQLTSSLLCFERWLRMLPRYTAETIDPDWTPAVCEITTTDVLAYLDSLRSKAGLDAAPKTKNNVRADLCSFFNWCIGIGKKGKAMEGITRRWHTMNPAAPVQKQHEAPGAPTVLSVKEADELMRYVENYKQGRLVPYFALALFAGIRPGPGGELPKLAVHPERDKPCREAGGRPLIDLARNVITITADIAKTGTKRVITIQPNLRRWLTRYGVDILPAGHDRDLKEVRKENALGHDVLRHSFISYHIGAFRSMGSTALEAGNSETIIRKHYMNQPTEKEGAAFFKILPAGTDKKVIQMQAKKRA